LVESQNLMGLSEDRFHDRDEVSCCGEMMEAKNSLELLKANHCGCSSHKPHYGCMRQEIHYEP